MARKREVNIDLALAFGMEDSRGNRLMWTSRGEGEYCVHWLDEDGKEQVAKFPDTPEGIQAWDKEINKAFARAWDASIEARAEESDEENSQATKGKAPWEDVEQIPLESEQMIRMAAAFDRGQSKADVINAGGIYVSQEEAAEKFYKSMKKDRAMRKSLGFD